jgi:hypothetical protein
MALDIVDDPEYWRKRAEEARTLAQEMTAGLHQKHVLGVAESYEKIAKWVEERTRESR